MSLKPCKECGKEISTKAENCPQCGVKVSSAGCFPSLIIGGVIFGALITLSNNNVTTNKPDIVALKTNEEIAENQQAITSTVNIWQYNTPIDKVSGKYSKTAYIQSNNIVNLDFPYSGGTYATLIIRKHPRQGKDVFVTINKGQLNCQYNNCYISLRFDDGPVIKNYVTEPSDNSNLAYFLSKTNNIISKIKNSKKMYIELTFFSQGTHTFEFNTQNFDDALVS